MRLGAEYEEERTQEEQQITPSVFQNIGPDIEDNNFTANLLL